MAQSNINGLRRRMVLEGADALKPQIPSSILQLPAGSREWHYEASELYSSFSSASAIVIS
jgi:hypothetical protein